jgi:hypothetical protein
LALRINVDMLILVIVMLQIGAIHAIKSLSIGQYACYRDKRGRVITSLDCWRELLVVGSQVAVNSYRRQRFGKAKKVCVQVLFHKIVSPSFFDLTPLHPVTLRNHVNSSRQGDEANGLDKNRKRMYLGFRVCQNPTTVPEGSPALWYTEVTNFGADLQDIEVLKKASCNMRSPAARFPDDDEVATVNTNRDWLFQPAALTVTVCMYRRGFHCLGCQPCRC